MNNVFLDILRKYSIERRESKDKVYRNYLYKTHYFSRFSAQNLGMRIIHENYTINFIIFDHMSE